MSPRQKLPERTTPAAAMADAKLLGGAFRGESWARWGAVLKAAYAEPLDETELALFREVAEREPPSRQVKELWCIVGRRGGKDSIASAVAAVAALGDYRAQLRPGERATVMCLAVDRDQARIIHRYIAAYFKARPLLSGLIERETDDGLELNNGVEIVIATNSYRAVRGRTIVCVIMDEVAFWRSEESTTPDAETYTALLPAMVTIPNAILVGITTAYRRKGLAFDRWRDAYGKPDDDVLVVLGTSQQFNPLLPAEVISRHLERDPEAAAAEWLSEWRSDLADFLDRELVEAAIDVGTAARPPRPDVTYFAGADPSGGRGNAFTAAISHAEGDRVVLDALFERRSPFEPASTVAEVAALLREYGITGDNFAAEWVVDAFRAQGTIYRRSERNRSAIYIDCLPLFTAGRARLLDTPRLTHQFVALERRTSRAGKDSVSKPPGGADDLCNAAALSLVLAAADAAPSLISQSTVRSAVVPDGDLGFCYGVYGVLWQRVDGLCAWALFALSASAESPLMIVDFDEMPWNAAILDTLARRLDEVAEAARDGNARSKERGVSAVLYVQEQLVTAADAALERAFAPRFDRIDFRAGRRVIGAEAIEYKFVSDPVKLAFNASAHWSEGRVRVMATAGERGQSVPLLGAMAIRPGSRIDDDPLRIAIFLGVVMGLDRAADYDAPSIPAARIAAW
jgi:hypothetical protein